MSIQLGFLAILTEGPAYGSQLHSEFLRRAAHRAHVNAGQVYSTLERLRKQDLIARSGTTQDGLPLFALTGAGEDRAHAWLTGGTPVAFTGWDDLQDHVLIAASLAGGDPHAIIAGYRHTLSHDLPRGIDVSPAAYVCAQSAHNYEREALEHWFDELSRMLREHPTLLLTVREEERPRRGRPSHAEPNR